MITTITQWPVATLLVLTPTPYDRAVHLDFPVRVTSRE
jgi:hypothetical protein